MSEYYRIGEFARLIQKSSQTLRNWDKSGILKPAAVDQNGRKLCDILIPIDEALKDYPKAVAKSGTEKILQNGGKIHTSQTKDALYDAKGLYRVYTASGVFVGLFRYSKEREELKPEKMFL